MLDVIGILLVSGILTSALLAGFYTGVVQVKEMSRIEPASEPPEWLQSAVNHEERAESRIDVSDSERSDSTEDQD